MITNSKVALDEVFDGVKVADAVNAIGEFGSISPMYVDVEVVGQDVAVAPDVGVLPPVNPGPTPPGPVKDPVKVVKDLVVVTVTDLPVEEVVLVLEVLVEVVVKEVVELGSPELVVVVLFTEKLDVCRTHATAVA